MANEIFKYITSINVGMTINVDSDYNKFMTGRGLSMHANSVLFANAINMYPKIDNQMHYDFLRSTVSPGKRFGKWPKPTKHAEASLISKYYQIPMIQAYLYLPLISKDQLEEIKSIVSQRDSE